MTEPECRRLLAAIVDHYDAMPNWNDDHYRDALEEQIVAAQEYLATTPEPAPDSAVREAWAMQYIRWMREDFAAELDRRRAQGASPGGQQVGPSELAGVPISVLKRFERDLRSALERTDNPPQAKPDPPRLCAAAEVVGAVRAWQAAWDAVDGCGGPPHEHERNRIEYNKRTLERHHARERMVRALRTATLRSEADVREETLRPIRLALAAHGHCGDGDIVQLLTIAFHDEQICGNEKLLNAIADAGSVVDEHAQFADELRAERDEAMRLAIELFEQRPATYTPEQRETIERWQKELG